MWYIQTIKYYLTIIKVVYGEFTITWEIKFERKVKAWTQNRLKIFIAANGEGFTCRGLKNKKLKPREMAHLGY